MIIITIIIKPIKKSTAQGFTKMTNKDLRPNDQVSLVDMRSAKKLSHHHVKCVVNHHRFCSTQQSELQHTTGKKTNYNLFFLNMEMRRFESFIITCRWCCESSWRPAPHDPTHTEYRSLSQAERRPQSDLHQTHTSPQTQSGKGRFHTQQNLWEGKPVGEKFRNQEVVLWLQINHNVQ